MLFEQSRGKQQHLNFLLFPFFIQLTCLAVVWDLEVFLLASIDTKQSSIQTFRQSPVILFRIEYIKSPLILLLRSYNMAEGLGNFLHLTNHCILALTLCLPNVSFGLPWCLSMNSRNVNKCIVNHVCLFAFLLKPHGVLTVGNG